MVKILLLPWLRSFLVNPKFQTTIFGLPLLLSSKHFNCLLYYQLK